MKAPSVLSDYYLKSKVARRDGHLDYFYANWAWIDILRVKNRHSVRTESVLFLFIERVFWNYAHRDFFLSSVEKMCMLHAVSTLKKKTYWS